MGRFQRADQHHSNCPWPPGPELSGGPQLCGARVVGTRDDRSSLEAHDRWHGTGSSQLLHRWHRWLLRCHDGGDRTRKAACAASVGLTTETGSARHSFNRRNRTCAMEGSGEAAALSLGEGWGGDGAHAGNAMTEGRWCPGMSCWGVAVWTAPVRTGALNPHAWR
jgi:hypothetical protein